MSIPLSSSFSNAVSITHMAIASLGVLLNGILLFSIIKDRRRLQQRRNDFLGCLMLIGALFIWSLTLFIGYIGVIANNGITDDAVGSFICNFQGFGLHLVTGVAVNGHMILGMERHSTIILNQHVPAKAAIGHLLGVIFIQTSTGIVHMALTEPSFEPLESGSPCLFRFTSSKTVDVWLPISAMAALSFSFTMLWVVYLKIYMRVLSVDRDVKDVGKFSELALSPTPVSSNQTEVRSIPPLATSKKPDPLSTYPNGQSPTTSSSDIHTNLQRHVLKRCVVILFCFQAFYGPLFFTIIYRLITHQHIDPVLEVCSTLFAELDTPVTPIMFLYFDVDIRTAVRGFVWEPAVRGVRFILRIR
ncbi:hypothetical protein HK102_013064 [Quaeritorhiza haematococci]|nr:hypothetical protein HK102_013064 [Quaeritorhiza haematococci]